MEIALQHGGISTFFAHNITYFGGKTISIIGATIIIIGATIIIIVFAKTVVIAIMRGWVKKGGYSDVKGCPTNIICRAPIVNTCLSISRMLIHAHRLRYIFNFTKGIAYHVNVVNVIDTNKE